RAAPWADIVEGIAAGTLRIHSKKSFGRDWRYAVTVDEAEFGRFPDRVAGAGDPCGNEPWLTRDQTAQLLGVDETIVWGLGKQEFLTKREGHVAMFSRAGVERAARRD